MSNRHLPTTNRTAYSDNDTAELEQEFAEVKPFFDELNRIGMEWAEADPHGIVDLPNRLKGPLADDPTLAMLALLLRIQQDENMLFVGVHYMKDQATTLYNLEANDCISRLIDQEQQGQEERLRKALNILRHLDQWLDDVRPYFEVFEERRIKTFKHEGKWIQGFKHTEMIRHYFPLDPWDQNFATFQAIGALRDSIVEAVSPGLDPVPTDRSTTPE
nr:hypothetical protein [Legionellales bacterium]